MPFRLGVPSGMRGIDADFAFAAAVCAAAGPGIDKPKTAMLIAMMLLLIQFDSADFTSPEARCKALDIYCLWPDDSTTKSSWRGLHRFVFGAAGLRSGRASLDRHLAW